MKISLKQCIKPCIKKKLLEKKNPTPGLEIHHEPRTQTNAWVGTDWAMPALDVSFIPHPIPIHSCTEFTISPKHWIFNFLNSDFIQFNREKVFFCETCSSKRYYYLIIIILHDSIQKCDLAPYSAQPINFILTVKSWTQRDCGLK